MRTSFIAPLGLGLAVTIAGCSWFEGERSTAPPHTAAANSSQTSSTMTPASASATRNASNPTDQQVRQAQEKLRQLGMYKGRVDGIYGPLTTAAVNEFQSKNGLPQTGELTDATDQRLRTAQANRRQNQPRTAQQPAPNNQRGNAETSAVPSDQNPNASPSANAPNNQPSH